MPTICNDAVHAVFATGLALRERLEAGESIDWEFERANLHELLTVFTPVSDTADRDIVFTDEASPDDRCRFTQATIRLALICWLDEWFTQYTTLGLRWCDADRFGPADGSAKFWEEARYAETRGDLESLETMHLCVMLGFRGAWRDRSADIAAWAKRIGATLAQPASVWTTPACLEPPRRDAMTRDDLPYRRMAFSVLLTLSLLLPIMLILFWRM